MIIALPGWMADRLLAHEGGYVNDPRDPGGETKFGISKRAYPQLDIKNLTREQAIAIYDRDYYSAFRLNELPEAVAYCVLDFGVNAGPGRAVKALQRVLGLTTDGKLGPKTIAAVRAATGQAELIRKYQVARAQYYVSLNNPTEERFEAGWLARTIDVTVSATLKIGA